MSAIRPHETDVVDMEWDGAEEEARLRSGEDEAYYHRMYAWQDPDADPTTKSAYKLPHHRVSAEGEPGAAVVKACQTAIAALNGARGGVDIPDADREGVWEHLASHLEDADVEPAPLKRGLEIPIAEFRMIPRDLELRDAGKDTSPGVIAASPGIPYGVPASDLMSFAEVIEPGAAGESLGDERIICTFNHDPSLLLGRVGNGTLELTETKGGVDWRCVLPDTVDGEKVVKLIRDGYVWGASFTFVPLDETWEGNVRHITRMEVYEVGPVSFPAYDKTRVSLTRGVLNPREELALRRSLAGFATGEDKDVLYRAYRYLAGIFQGDDAERKAARTEEGRGLSRAAAILREILARL